MVSVKLMAIYTYIIHVFIIYIILLCFIQRKNGITMTARRSNEISEVRNVQKVDIIMLNDSCKIKPIHYIHATLIVIHYYDLMSFFS